MDMSQYSGAAFLKVGDVKVNGPIRVVIADIVLGKYGKPDVSFSDGTKLSLNATNNKNSVPSLRHGGRRLDRQGNRIVTRRDRVSGQAARSGPGQADLAADRKEAAEAQARRRHGG